MSIEIPELLGFEYIMGLTILGPLLVQSAQNEFELKV